MQWNFKSVYFNNFKGSIIRLDVTYPTQPSMIILCKTGAERCNFQWRNYLHNSESLWLSLDYSFVNL